MIRPHGGKLIHKVLQGEALHEALEEAQVLQRLGINSDVAIEVKNIARGVFSPLEGFVGSTDFHNIINNDRLATGIPWTIPIILDVDSRDIASVGQRICLIENGQDSPLAIVEVEEIYTWDKRQAAQAVFGTTDVNHPGVAGFYKRGDYLIGGPVALIDNNRGQYAEFNLFPAETRAIFKERGWRTICAFQTRNVPHRGHEELQKTVLGLVDGLFIQPVIGRKKSGDFRDEVILDTYQVLIDNYYPKDRTLLNILPFNMQYAGPKEAIMHAIMRKNYGCTHIIIGRDHAGVGNYYGEEDAIRIFAEPRFAELEIEPVTIRGDFWYCRKCARVASDRTCPHPPEQQISFSGTKIRRLIDKGEAPSPEIMRPEVFEVIQRFDNPLIG